VHLNKGFDRKRQIIAGKINAPLNLACDILRDVFRPILCGVECDHANRVAVLARHQIGDDGFKIGLLDFGFGKRGAKVSEIIDDKINGLSVAASRSAQSTGSSP